MTGAWERFWFSTTSASTLAVVRITFALVVLAWTLSLTPDLATLFGPGGLVDGAKTYLAVYLLLLAGAVCMAVGYRTRIASAVVFGALLWFDHVNPWASNSGDAVLRHLAFVLMLAPSGAALSLDRLRARGALAEFPAVGIWSLRLVQLQLSVIYLASVAAKLQGDAWQEGVAASLALGVPDAIRFPLPELVTSSPAAAHALTWGTIGLEAAIGLLVWNRRLRPWILGAGVCFHLMIDLALRAGFFSWAMLVCYLAFLPPETAARVIERASRPVGRFRESHAPGLAPAQRARTAPNLTPTASAAAMDRPTGAATAGARPVDHK